jgi:hypothetical protein
MPVNTGRLVFVEHDAKSACSRVGPNMFYAMRSDQSDLWTGQMGFPGGTNCELNAPTRIHFFAPASQFTATAIAGGAAGAFYPSPTALAAPAAGLI